MDDDLKEIAADFIRESNDLLGALDQDFVELEKTPDDQELINRIFRGFHTVKGGASFLGFQKLVDLCQHAESLMSKARNKDLRMTPEIIDVVFQALDLAKACLKTIEEGNPDAVEVDALIRQLDVAAQTKPAAQAAPPAAVAPMPPAPSPAVAPTPPASPTVSAQPPPHPSLPLQGGGDIFSSEDSGGGERLPPVIPPAAPTATPAPSAAVLGAPSTVSPPGTASHLPADREAKKKMLGEILIDLGIITDKELHDVLEEQRGHPETPRLGDLLVKKGLATQKDIHEALKVQQVAHKPEVAKEVETTIRIDVERLDEIMNLVGELVLSRNRLMKLSSDLESSLGADERYESLTETVSHLNIITTNLQMGVMKTRMQPVRRLLNKFPRMVRDIAKKRGKELDFVVEGEETELDKSVLDEIGDPLIHLVRNSIDHGIEDPETRVRNGKPPKGRVVLRAFHEGNRIGISIADDGRGMDIERIKEKALESGKVTTDDLQRMTRDEILNLIFLPGFSTAKQVDDVSGRGVGMDVVKNNVGKLNGTIEINTEEGKGSSITLRLPLTIAIIQTLLVRECGQVFALPLTSVLEIAKLRAEEIRLVNRRRVLNLRNHILPLASVGEKFGLHGARSLEECAYVIVLGIAEKRVGLAVGELLGGEEITIKSVGKVMTDVRGIAGASITGDGQIVLVADLPELFSELAVGFHERAAA